MSGATVGSITSPVMVGRESESVRLDRSLAALAAGNAGLVIISGEAGIGKTRFIDEALARAGDELRVLRGTCLALGTEIPYLPFAELLRDLARQLPAHRLAHLIGPARADLARFLPQIAASLGDADGDTRSERLRSDDVERLRLYEAFLRVTERIAADQPTVVVVEDVQWIDRASLELLAFLAHGVRQNDQATLIISVRPEEIEDKEHVLVLLAALDRTSNAERIELTALGADATERIATAILGEPPSPELAAHVQALSDGNPLFTEELLASWRRRGPQAALPPKLHDLLSARLAQVPPDVLEVLRIAAAAGRTVDDQLLTRVSELDEEHVRRAVRTAVDDHILIRAEGPVGAGYRFRHEILRSLVADQLLPSEARRIHAAYAAALSDQAPEYRDRSELARHWDAAGEYVRALEAHIQAGVSAVSALAFDIASSHYERALELWSAVPDPAAVAGLSHGDLVEAAASASARAGAFDRAVELMRSLIEQGELPDENARQLARSSLRWYLWEAGELEAALAEAERASADADIPDRWRANALGHAAALLLYLQRTPEAATRAAEARDVATEVEAEEERILAEGVLGWCRLLEGDTDGGLDGIRRAVAGAEAAALVGRYPVGSALAHSQLATALELAGRLEETHEVAVSGARIAAQHGVARTFGSVLAATAARSLYQLGRWDEAAAAVDADIDAGAVGSGRISLLAVRALLDVGLGHLARAATTTSMAESLLDEHTPLDVRRWLTAATVELALWNGDAAGALARLAFVAAEADAPTVAAPGAQPTMLDASIPYLLALSARACSDAAIAERARGEPADLSQAARDRVARALDRASRRKALASVWAGDLALARAELTRSDDTSVARRIDRWRNAVERLAGRPYLAAYATWRLAEAELAHRDGRSVAAPLLTEAREAADGLNATPLADAVSGLARRARLEIAAADEPTSRRSDGGAKAFGLTSREAEVLVLVADGLSNQEIADRLFISPKTASVHVSNIYAKLGVESRVAAATLAHDMGLDRDMEAS